ncbi:hypothetical protein H072_8481 [Dactylellina haptotyla CBS 200.50]|uniref:FAD-binding domain-containing protein n=1 Tax=Dactylellina haptotyla (strain CBS 200.50) TaxID=1284197 RepID=S8A4E6_DACHA|nr:hypothetical protein H072_8481 [Dactylellina haptotyla CBS 200.50]
MPSKPILISGGGISSLLLAQSLRGSGIPFKIFERDSSFVFRAQGYRLRLSSEGLDAIESVLDSATWEKFWDKCSKTGGAGFEKLNAITAEPYEEENKNKPAEKLLSRDGRVVGIARGDMRTVFADGCEEYIEWNRKVTGYELTDDGVRAIFADGTKSEEGSLLVGGEGIYSHVARQVSDGKIKTFDTGAVGIHGQAPSPAFKELGEGVFSIKDKKTGIWAITNVRPGDKDDPNAMMGWTMGGPPGSIPVPNNDYTIIGKRAADIAQEATKDWHPRFKPLFERMDVPEAAFWKITCSSPSGVPQWQNQSRVTVIGDAVHSMTPAGGIGANTAVRDSALLGKLLKEAGGWAPGVTEAYEKEMRVYGSEAVNISYTLGTDGFGINIDEATSKLV